MQIVSPALLFYQQVLGSANGLAVRRLMPESTPQKSENVWLSIASATVASSLRSHGCKYNRDMVSREIGFVPALSFAITRLNQHKPFLPREDPLILAKSSFFRPRLRRPISQHGQRYLFVHVSIISRCPEWYSPFFCAVVPEETSHSICFKGLHLGY